MPRKLSIEVPEIGKFEASSKRSLIALIERERDHWMGYFPDGIPCRQVERAPIHYREFQYDGLLRFANDTPANELEAGAVSQPLHVFPPTDSAIGRTLDILAKSGSAVGIEAIASTMPVRLMASGALQHNFIRRNEQTEFIFTTARLIEAMAVLISGYDHSDGIATSEAAARELLDQIAEDRATADQVTKDLEKFAGDETATRQHETSRFRLLRTALMERYKSRGNLLLSEWDEKFSEAHELYINKLQFEAPVRLWNSVATGHGKRAKSALVYFLATLLVMAGFAAFIVLGQGDVIAGSFHQEVCPASDPANCQVVFSMKGPLTVGAVLLVASLLLWLMKIFNRTYREAGQRADNAAERKAFVQTYEAMMRSNQGPEEHRAIILNAIFRPSKDGQPVDDNSGLDVSALSIASRFMAK